MPICVCVCFQERLTKTHGERGCLQAGGFDARDEGVLDGGVVDEVGERRDDVEAQLLEGAAQQTSYATAHLDIDSTVAIMLLWKRKTKRYFAKHK